MTLKEALATTRTGYVMNIRLQWKAQTMESILLNIVDDDKDVMLVINSPHWEEENDPEDLKAVENDIDSSTYHKILTKKFFTLLGII